MTIAELIRLTRQQKGLSQSELANRSGVDLKSLSRYELGTSIPPANVLKDLADAMGVSADALLGENAAIRDKELINQFKAIEAMEEDDRNVVKKLIDAFITKKQIQKLAQ